LEAAAGVGADPVGAGAAGGRAEGGLASAAVLRASALRPAAPGGHSGVRPCSLGAARMRGAAAVRLKLGLGQVGARWRVGEVGGRWGGCGRVRLESRECGRLGK